MTPGQKRKFLEAVEEIERGQGSQTRLEPKDVTALLKCSYADLWEELLEPLAIAHATQLIVAMRGAPIRSRRPAVGQLTLQLPGFGETTIPDVIQIPPRPRRGSMPNSKDRHGRWVKTLEASFSEYALWVRRKEQRLKETATLERKRLKIHQKLLLVARAGSGGKVSMRMRDALATQAAKQKAKAVGLGAGWLFNPAGEPE